MSRSKYGKPADCVVCIRDCRRDNRASRAGLESNNELYPLEVAFELSKSTMVFDATLECTGEMAALQRWKEYELANCSN